jgi:signal transduction histidine kinase
MTACAVVLVALLASVIITSRQVAPLTDMAEASRKLAAGDFGVRVHTDRKDEIGELADAFNIMAAAIEKSEMSRREFVANISHELKTPMTTIAGFADGLLDGTIPRDQADRYLSIISDETRRLSRLVKRMLDISRMQSVDRASIMKSSFDVAEVARCALLALEDKINGKGLDIDVQLPEEPMMVHGEEDAITQVIYNIIDNAVKFADAGSSVTLRVWKQGEKAFVSVGDVGETIPSEDMPFIFERFHKSDHSRSLDRDGVGLGLYIVKAILSGYGEEISVTSENSYTEFTFTLSLVKTQ